MATADTPPHGGDEAGAFERAPEFPLQATSSGIGGGFSAEEGVAAAEIVPAAAEVRRIVRSASFPSLRTLELHRWPLPEESVELDSEQQHKKVKTSEAELRPLSPSSPHSFPTNGCCDAVTSPTSSNAGQISAVVSSSIVTDAVEEVFRLLQRPEHAHVASAVCREWRDVFESRTRDVSIVYDMRTARWEPCFRDVSNCSFATAWHPGLEKFWVLDDPSLCMPQHVRFTSLNPWFTPSLVTDLTFPTDYPRLEPGITPDGKQIAGLIKRFPNLTSVSIPVTFSTALSDRGSYQDEGVSEALSAVATCKSLRSFRLQIRFPHGSPDDYDSFNLALTERLAEIFRSCPRLRSFQLQMNMFQFATADQLPDLGNVLSLARSTPSPSSPSSSSAGSGESINSSASFYSSTPSPTSSPSPKSSSSSSSSLSSASPKQQTTAKHRLSHLSLPIDALPNDILSAFPYLRSLQLHLTCETQPAVFAIAAPFSQLRVLHELRISLDTDFESLEVNRRQGRNPSLSPDLFSGLEHSLRKLTFNLRGASRTGDDGLEFIPDIDSTSSTDTEAVNSETVVLPDSIWTLTNLEELETDLCSRGAVRAAARRQERRAQLERRTALRVLGFNEAATAAAAAAETATAMGTATTTETLTDGLEDAPLDEPRFAGLQRLTSLTLTARRWASPPASLRHLPNLTRLHMPVAAPSLSSRPGVGLLHLKSLRELCMCMGNAEVTQEQQKQPFLPTGLESLTLHGGDYNGWCLSRWASSTITKLKLVNVECAAVPEAECLFPNLRVFQAIESVPQIGVLPNLKHMLVKPRPDSLDRLLPHPNLTFLRMLWPYCRYPIPPMPKLEILILDPFLASSRTLECLSSFTTLRFLRIYGLGTRRGRTGRITFPPKLKTLEIHQSTFSCLPKSFECFQRIRKLRLIDCEEMKSLPEYLVAFDRITELTIRGCKEKVNIPKCIEAVLAGAGYKYV